MTTHRQRASSPQAPRVYAEPPRATTGTLLTAYDTRFDSRPRNSFSSMSSARDTLSSRHNSVYETQPVSKRTYVDPTQGGGTISRTQYSVRPRRDSDIVDTRRPLTVVTKNSSPTRDRAEIVDSPSQMVVYKAPREEPSNTSRYLLPTQSRGSPHHQRHSSASRAEVNQFRAPPAPRPRQEKEYHRRGPYVEKVPDARSPPPIRYSDEEGFSYTGPREQFARDYPVRPARRESTNRRERPTSALDLKLEPPVRRDTAPQALALVPRHSDRVEREERKTYDSDPDRSRVERQPRNSTKGTVVHQRDDGYSSAQDYDPRRPSRARPQEDEMMVVGKSRYRDAPREYERERERPRRDYEREDDRPSDRDRDRERDRDRDRDREREKGSRRHDRPKDREYERERARPKEYETIEEDEPTRRSKRRDSSTDRSAPLKTLATAAVGGLAAAGIAGRKSGKENEVSDAEDRRERRHRRRKSRDPRDDDVREEEDPDADRQRKERKPRRDDSSGSDTPQDKPRRRPASRTRTRRDTNDGYGSERERPQLALPAPEPERRSTRDQETDSSQQHAANEMVAARAQQESPTDHEGRTLSPGNGEDTRPRKVSIVEPVKKEEFKPKGILKKPREVPFPEDPNPTREGVAPLKQAGKDGIPEGARWTKVSRILVNPEALEKFHERYEERDDYVIVLRVLSKEEIAKLAEKTKQIRDQREHDWQKQVEERRRRQAERGDRDRESEHDYDDDSQRGPLAIEAPPTTQPMDLRQLAAGGPIQNPAQSQPQLVSMPQQIPPYQHHHQQQSQQGYPPQMPWNSGAGPSGTGGSTGSARSSGEAMATAVPMGNGVSGPAQNQHQGQPMQHQVHSHPQTQQPEFDASTYSQNV